jgi:hypothetical protein
MHPLGRLIAKRMDMKDHRWAVRDVERRARAAGERLNKTTVSDLRRKMTPTITKANIYGLAAGLGVTPLTVGLAALESWDIETHPVEVTDSLATVAIDPTLSDRDRRQLRALITDMRRESSTPPATGDGDDVWKPDLSPLANGPEDEQDTPGLSSSP